MVFGLVFGDVKGSIRPRQLPSLCAARSAKEFRISPILVARKQQQQKR